MSQLDAGYWWTDDDGETYPFRGQGITVPRLEDVLSAFGDDMLFSVEIKQQSPSITDAVLATLEQTGTKDRTVIGSFDPGPLQEIRDADATVLTAFAVGEGIQFYYLDDDAEEDYEPPARVLAAPTELGDIVLDGDLLAKAERHDIAVQVWTINERDEMERLLDMGVQGIITDDVPLLEQILVERGLR